MNSFSSRVALAFVIFGAVFLIWRAATGEKNLQNQSVAVPFLLECQECKAMFNFDKREWAARSYGPDEWKPEYRDWNDCLECGAKWKAKIIGEGKPSAYVPPEPPAKGSKVPKKPPDNYIPPAPVRTKGNVPSK